MPVSRTYRTSIQYINGSGELSSILDEGVTFPVKLYKDDASALQACIKHGMRIARGEDSRIYSTYSFIKTLAGVGVMVTDTNVQPLNRTLEEVTAFLKEEGLYGENSKITMQETVAILDNGHNSVWVVYRLLNNLKVVPMRTP